MVDQGLTLGHIVSSKGIEVNKTKVNTIKRPYPNSVQKVLSFLGHAGFNRRFIKDFSKITQPLCKLLQQDVAFEFDETYRIAFDMIKEMLITTPSFKLQTGICLLKLCVTLATMLLEKYWEIGLEMYLMLYIMLPEPWTIHSAITPRQKNILLE